VKGNKFIKTNTEENRQHFLSQISIFCGLRDGKGFYKYSYCETSNRKSLHWMGPSNTQAPSSLLPKSVGPWACLLTLQLHFLPKHMTFLLSQYIWTAEKKGHCRDFSLEFRILFERNGENWKGINDSLVCKDVQPR
jgi:hypothetical protein